MKLSSYAPKIEVIHMKAILDWSKCFFYDESKQSHFSSLKILTPSSTAFLYFDPGFSPTTTKFVLFDTLELTIPPKDSASACISFLSLDSLPVKTTVLPLKMELLTLALTGSIFNLCFIMLADINLNV